MSDRGESWGRALAKALAMLVVSVLAFMVVPDLLAGWLSAPTSTVVRDLAVIAWTSATLVGACWLLLRIQRSRTEAAAEREPES